MQESAVIDGDIADDVGSDRPVAPPLRWAMLIALIGPALTFVALPAALPQIAAFFGNGTEGHHLAQQLQTLPFLGLAVGGLLAGWAIGALGHHRLLTLAAVFYGLAGMIGLLSRSPALLMLACTTLGLAGSLMTCNLIAVAGRMLGPARRTRLLGFQTVISDFSTVAGSICGALLAQFLGWHGPFLLYTLYGAGMLALALAITKGSLPQAPRTRAADYRSALAAWPTYAAAIWVFLLVGTLGTQLPFLLAAKGLSSPAVRSVVLTCATSAAMLGALIYALGHARIGTLAARAGAALLAAAGFAALSFWSGSLLLACLPALAIGLGIGVTVPSLFAAALQRVTPELRGHSIGLVNSAIFLGSFLSPYVFTPLASSAGYPSVFVGASLLAVILGVLGLTWARLPVSEGPL